MLKANIIPQFFSQFFHSTVSESFMVFICGLSVVRSEPIVSLFDVEMGQKVANPLRCVLLATLGLWI
jgi:hypothetical protein